MRTATLPALLGLVCALAAVPLNASAQTWPDNPVVLVVPYSAGGPTDVVARLLAIPMAKSLGQLMVESASATLRVNRQVGQGDPRCQHQGE
jgi:tripartite-type tricarboxylate transporter receptor subunit TctC